MFIGTYNNSIDAKNRMIVPAKFREELGLRCVITRGLDDCLYIYTMAEWNEMLEKLNKVPTSSREGRAFVRAFTGKASECELDRQGRVTIPQDLRKDAGIIKELVTIGCNDKIEVWAQEAFEKEEQHLASSDVDLGEVMEKYGI